MERLLRSKKQNNDRRFPGIKGKRPDLKAARKKIADENLANWSQLTPVQQLKELDKRFGAGNGAKKQRARLAVSVNKVA